VSDVTGPRTSTAGATEVGAQLNEAGGKGRGKSSRLLSVGGALRGVARQRARRAGLPAAPAVLIVPALGLVGYFIVLPIATVVLHAFTNWQPGMSSPFDGLANFRALTTSEEFRSILGNEAFLLLGLPFWVAVPVLISFALYERVRGANVFRAVLFFPSMTSPALIGVLFGLLLSPIGPIDRILTDLHMGFLAQNWLANSGLVKPVLLCVTVWWVTGIGVVLFSANLATLPQNLLEQAEIDGAGWMRKLWTVVVPDLLPTLRVWLLLLMIIVLGNMFPWIYTLTHGGPGYASTTLDYFIYNTAINIGQFGPAAAATVVLLALLGICIGLGMIVMKLAKWR